MDNAALFRLIFAGIVLALTHSYRVLTKSTSRLPGPWYSKWTTAVLTIHWLKGRRSQYVHGLHGKYGPIVRIGPNEVGICDIDALKTIYSAREVFIKSSWYTSLTTSANMNVFNTDDVDFHRRVRRLLSGPMSDSSLAAMLPIISARVDVAIEKMRGEMKARGAADVFKWWLFMSTDVIGELSFGESFRMLEQGKKNQYIKDLEDVAPLGALRATFPFLARLATTLPLLPAFRRAASAGRNMTRYAEESLARYENLLVTDPSRVKQTLFTKVFASKESDKLSFGEIRNEARAYIIAGSDTVANTLTYVVWCLCTHPRAKETLLEELSSLPERFGDAELKKLPYLAKVIDEALRLYSAAPSGLPRVVPPGGAELAGYRLDGGTTVCVQAYSMHRDPSIFPRPEAFDPSRWETPTKAMKDAFMPFGAGSRICLGLHLARIELRLATARFLLAFPDADISYDTEGMSDKDMEPRIYFLLSPSGRRCLVRANSCVESMGS